MGNELLKASSTDTNREVIQRYLVSEPGEIELTLQQEKLLARWEYADELIRIKAYAREAIARLIMAKFKVSRATAFQDIVNTEHVFASSTPLNKRYRIGLRIEYLERIIFELHKSKDKFKILAAVSLEGRLAKYYELYPDITPTKAPTTIVYQVMGSVLPSVPMTTTDAIIAAQNYVDIEDIEPINEEDADN